MGNFKKKQIINEISSNLRSLTAIFRKFLEVEQENDKIIVGPRSTVHEIQLINLNTCVNLAMTFFENDLSTKNINSVEFIAPIYETDESNRQVFKVSSNRDYFSARWTYADLCDVLFQKLEELARNLERNRNLIDDAIGEFEASSNIKTE